MVVVLADDLGWSDLASGRVNTGNGNDFHETPTLDRLAREGTVFPRAYASPSCSPTRAALLTGMTAVRPDNNIYAVVDMDRRDQSLRRATLEPPPQGLSGNGGNVLPDRAVTIAEMMGAAGYATGYAGKFHVTASADAITTQHGFDSNLGGSTSGGPGQYHAEVQPDGGSEFSSSVDPSLDVYAGPYDDDYVRELAEHANSVSPAALEDLVGTAKHVTDALADASIDLIDASNIAPTFTFVGQYAVHTPVDNRQARSDLLAKYRAKPAGDDPSGAAYAALTEGLDQTVGRIIDHLESTPDPRQTNGSTLADNTVVIVTSDNGGDTEAGANNKPLRGQKGEVLEGGTRVPWIAWSANPNLVAPGAINNSVIDSTDLYATLADYANAPRRPDAPLDGTSLAPLLANGGLIDRTRFLHSPNYFVGAGRNQRPSSVARQGALKLVYSYEDRRARLFNTDRDPGERRNLAQARPRVVREMGEQLMRYLDRSNAPLATLRPQRGRVTIRVESGDWTYRDGRIVRHRRAGEVTASAGDEVPLVLRRVKR